jgi:leucyl-tRNA synthetase
MSYDFKSIESKWQKRWEESGRFIARESSDRTKFYCLVMFPYPSAYKLHVGHAKNYVLGDVIARYKRIKGFNVFHPMGWDSFGLPAENAAIENKVDPEKWTLNNIDYMRVQLKELGISYDWTKEFATCLPDYYRWNQWFFIKMYEKGLAYRKEAPVNWCPSCGTVLANEQAEDGKCWRCHTPVEQRKLVQWFFKITQYADELLEGHELIKDGWPEAVLTMQKNWIGRSTGAEIEFEVPGLGEKLIVFTTRPDTLFGATFVTISPEHPVISKMLDSSDPAKKEEISKYIEKAKSRPTVEELLEKDGVFTGFHAKNPINGKQVPIWISDYVLMEYGTGAIMCVPAHDQRDYDFAKRYGLPIVKVVENENSDITEKAFEGTGTMVNSGDFNGLRSEEGKQKITRLLESKNIAKGKINYRLRDWLISRQRYWGTPIPVIYCDKCGTLPVREEDLPVLLPKNVTFTGKGESPLKYEKSFYHTTCYKCGGPAKRETDTMDTIVDSSWYYARYCDPRNSGMPFEPGRAEYWLPVDQYIGGVEHSCMHLIYARFFHKVMRDLGLLKGDEPFSRLLNQGMVTLDGNKMSKSYGNVVEQKAVTDRYGCDTLRFFLMFAAPPDKQLEWSDRGIEGPWRFINRVWRMMEQLKSGPKSGTDLSAGSGEGRKKLLKKLNYTVKKVTDDIEQGYQFNTALAAMMELLNALNEYENIGDDASRKAFLDLVVMLSPFTPHLCEEIWFELGAGGSVNEAKWPAYDPGMLAEDTVELPVQVNGRLRATISVKKGAPENEVKETALNDERVKKYCLNGIVRTIYVMDRVLNIVAK